VVSLNSLIDRRIARSEEVKTQEYSTSVSLFAATGTSWGVADLFPVSPYPGYVSIVQGVGQGDRIGNRIKTRRVILSYAIYPNPYHATTNPTPTPQEVDIYILADKNLASMPTTVGALATVYNTGDTSTGPTGSLVDLTRPINTDDFVVMRRIRHKVGFQAFVANPGGVATWGYASSSDFSLNVINKVDITSCVPKNITYNDTTTIPTSQIVYVYMQAVNADGSTQAAAILPLTMVYTIQFDYTDN
jgi:hypothetical protein